MTYRYSKYTTVIPTVKVATPLVATIFLENWITSYEIFTIMLTDNSPQFVSKFFTALFASLGVKLVTATEYHPQLTGLLER